ncbi:MAG: hypothetical protein KME57_01520 [Scytonema hyalinum WJT4-NPBG1]|jgi:hypothetical protein|nr:hypothetical protein [Scytonema hyalinum WJT4-NPBG1]
MHSQAVQNLRYKLQKRIQKFDTVDPSSFILYLKYFWIFFDSNPTYIGIMDLLISRYPETENVITDILNGKNWVGASEEEAAAIGYRLVRKLSEPAYENHLTKIAQVYAQFKSTAKITEIIRIFFLNPFYEYLDEQLDDQRFTLNLLIRYKHRSEWFHRDHLLGLTKSESRIAEKLLALDFYSYLHDQGLDFTIEPSSLSGEIDIIAAQGSGDPLLADAKIFDADHRSKSYLRKAFNQIYTYTQQYNEPFGYLVIFKITDRDLCFSVSSKAFTVPTVVYNHKTIFLLTIDICSYPKPVSQRNPLKTVTITEEELIQPMED